MLAYLTQEQADDLTKAWGGLPSWIRIIPKMRETYPENLHRDLDAEAGYDETNVLKNSETALHRILTK